MPVCSTTLEKEETVDELSQKLLEKAATPAHLRILATRYLG
jgi:hypothetical protein